MAKRNRANKLQRWEIALIKGIVEQRDLSDQDILAYFTRPTRSINHARIKEIRDGTKHFAVAAASPDEVAKFIAGWPHLDPATGLHVLGDELVIKAREAMMHAVQGYNSPRTYFKSEVFIVTAVIAWTYLLHWFYKSTGVDHRYKRVRDGVEEVAKTKNGAEKFWELETCLDQQECKLDDATKANLRFLIAIRHEIEHQMTRRIDDSISAKIQACCLNFNRALKELVGVEYGLDSDLSLALQFSALSRDQQDILFNEADLPANIRTMRDDFENTLPDELIQDPRYAYRVAFVEKVVNSKGKADQVVHFIKAGTEEAQEIQHIFLKETEKPKMKPQQIVAEMRAAGFLRFNTYHHTDLWKALGGRDPKKGYGVYLKPNDWWWYSSWRDRVREHCEANRDQYI